MRRDISDAFPDDPNLHWVYVNDKDDILASEIISGDTRNLLERHLFKDGKMHGVQATFLPMAKKRPRNLTVMGCWMACAAAGTTGGS